LIIVFFIFESDHSQHDGLSLSSRHSAGPFQKDSETTQSYLQAAANGIAEGLQHPRLPNIGAKWLGTNQDDEIAKYADTAVSEPETVERLEQLVGGSNAAAKKAQEQRIANSRITGGKGVASDKEIKVGAKAAADGANDIKVSVNQVPMAKAKAAASDDKLVNAQGSDTSVGGQKKQLPAKKADNKFDAVEGLTSQFTNN
jgi:hypothetical protein